MDVDMTSDAYPLEKLKKLVENSKDMTQTARQASERDRDYYDGHQISEADRKRLRSAGRADIVNNVIQRKVDAMVGIEQRGRVDPRALPRNPSGQQAADVATKALVYVDEVTRFDQLRSAAFENLLIEGYGGVEVIAEERKGKLDVSLNRIRWEEIVFDPYSRDKDFLDASYLGIVKWMTLDQAHALYDGVYQGQGEGDDLDTLLQTTLEADAGTYADRPQNYQGFGRWADPRQKRVQVAQVYYRRGADWRLAIFTGGGVIYEDVSPYVDEEGKTACPIILMTAYIDRENRRYGMVRSLIGAQDAVNAREERLLHQLSSRQTWGVKGAVGDVAKMKRELARPDGHIEVDPEAIEVARELGIQPFNIIQNSDQTAGQFQLLQESKQQIENLGPNAQLVGDGSDSQSGRAIMAQQQAGMATVAPIYDSLSDFTQRVYRAMWDRMRQFWTDERWIRVTDEIQAPQFLAINHVVGQRPVVGPDGQIVMQPIMENAVAEMDLDIIMSEAPDHVTLQQEQFEQLAKMAQSGIPIPPQVIVEASNLRDKPRILEAMQQAQQQAAQAQAGQAQAAQQAAQAELQIKAQATDAKATRDKAAAAKDMASIQPPQVVVAIPAAGV